MRGLRDDGTAELQDHEQCGAKRKALRAWQLAIGNQLLAMSNEDKGRLTEETIGQRITRLQGARYAHHPQF